MKRFITRVGARIFRFFWSWGFLKFVLWSVTILIFLYVEEDWRGARGWAATKAKWEARGISFDPSFYIPPPIPDSENLAALPLFDPTPDKKAPDPYTPVALRRALHDDSSNTPPFAPSLNYGWEEGRQPDLDEYHRDIAAFYAKVFGAPPATTDALAQWNALYPFVAELNAAAQTRPYFRLKEDYVSQPAAGRPFSLVVSQIKIAKVLSMHAILALDENRPELALMDIKTLLKMSQGVGREPSLVAGLVSGGLCSITTIAINRGLIVHGWNDAQLAELQTALADTDMLATGQHALRGECVVYSLPMIEWLKVKNNLPSFWADGWVDLAVSRTANHLLGAAGMFDPSAHRIDVAAAKQMTREADRLNESWMRFAPWNILFGGASGPTINAQRQFVRIQTRVDEGRIVCGLEWYRLAHGQYPDSLDVLVPACIDHLPCDPIDGQPYRYRLKSDGTFLLYSIGWNQKDDGGLLVLTLDDSKKTDESDSPSNYGDWVWPTAQPASAK